LNAWEGIPTDSHKGHAEQRLWAEIMLAHSKNYSEKKDEMIWGKLNNEEFSYQSKEIRTVSGDD
jgi:hypothetical protein